MTLGSFTPVSDFGEAVWIGAHLERFLPYLDEMVFYCDDCKDGTDRIIDSFRRGHKDGHKIKLFNGKKAGDDESFGRMFNACMWELSTDLAWFLHPDMWVENPEQIAKVKESKAVALTTHMTSYAGEPGGQLLRIDGDGRTTDWKNIYRLRSPNLGCHYFARFPGDPQEDCYFSKITGDEHVFQYDPSRYPYSVEDSGLKIHHFSDVRSYERRYFRMARYTELSGFPKEHVHAYVTSHPRINFKDGIVKGTSFKFVPTTYPKEFIENREQAKNLEVARA